MDGGEAEEKSLETVSQPRWSWLQHVVWSETAHLVPRPAEVVRYPLIDGVNVRLFIGACNAFGLCVHHTVTWTRERATIFFDRSYRTGELDSRYYCQHVHRSSDTNHKHAKA